MTSIVNYSEYIIWVLIPIGIVCLIFYVMEKYLNSKNLKRRYKNGSKKKVRNTKTDKSL